MNIKPRRCAWFEGRPAALPRRRGSSRCSKGDIERTAQYGRKHYAGIHTCTHTYQHIYIYIYTLRACVIQGKKINNSCLNIVMIHTRFEKKLIYMHKSPQRVRVHIIDLRALLDSENLAREERFSYYKKKKKKKKKERKRKTLLD